MGRRWGKTMMAGSVSLACAANGAAVAWVVPTYRNARPLWRMVEKFAGGVGDLSKSEMTARFPQWGDGWVGIYTADNDVSLRGEAFDLVIVDEAAQIKQETWADVIMPTLADRDGRAILISTPKGKNWFWQEWIKSDDVTSKAWNAPSNANPMPNIQNAYTLAKQRVSARTFAQEWDAQFIDDGGGVFRDVMRAATAAIQPHAQPNHAYAIGADWGRTNDATVFIVVDVTTRSACFIDRMEATPYSVQLSRLRALWERFGKPPIIAELNSMGGPQVESAQRAGLPVTGLTTTNASKAQWIDALALAFEQNAISIIQDKTLITELQAFESVRLQSGMVRYSAPAGLHDDTVMALALAWQIFPMRDAAIMSRLTAPQLVYNPVKIGDW